MTSPIPYFQECRRLYRHSDGTCHTKIDYNLHDIKKTKFSGFDIETVWNGNILIYLFYSYHFWRGVKITCFTFHICIVKHMQNSDAIAIHIYCTEPYYIRFKIYYEHKFFILCPYIYANNLKINFRSFTKIDRNLKSQVTCKFFQDLYRRAFIFDKLFAVKGDQW